MNLRKNGNKFLIAIEALALVAVLVLGIMRAVIPSESTHSKISGGGSGEDVSSETTDQGTDDSQAAATPEFNISESVSAKLSSMTTEEKVSQIFITRPEEITGVTTFTQAGNKTKEALSTYPLGGFVFRQDNFYGQEATSIMMSNLQSYMQERMGINMFLAIDEEGGDKLPLAAGNVYTAEAAPSQLGGADGASSSAANIASYMNASGLNMNLAPNVDIAYGNDLDYDNYTYGSDSTTAGDAAAAAISSYSSAGIYTASKTFPGKAKAMTDSATGMLWMTDNVENLEASDFISYQKSIEAGTTAIVMGNILCQSITGEETTPCSLSAQAAQYVRGTLGFQGILMTDDLSDTTLNNIYSQDEAAVAAVKAGMSMIYVSTGFESSYNAVLSAVNSGEISAETLDDAVARVLTAKGV